MIEAEREAKGALNLIQSTRAQSCDQTTDPGLGDGLQVVEVHGTLPGQTVHDTQDDFAGDAADYRGQRGNRDFAQD